MATVTGTFVDSAGNPLPASLAPEVRVIPSKPTITIGGKTIPTREQVVTPNTTTGAYTFNLEPTTDAHDRDFYYLLRGSYKMPNGYDTNAGYTQVDVFEHKLHVPGGGGDVGYLISRRFGNDLVYAAPDAVDPTEQTGFQFNTVTGDLYQWKA